MPRELKPCGTHAAYVRHHYYGEPPCDLCVAAARVYKATNDKNSGRRHTETYKARKAAYQQTEAGKTYNKVATANYLNRLTESQKEAHRTRANARQLSRRRTNLAREALPVDTETEMWLKENGTD